MNVATDPGRDIRRRYEFDDPHIEQTKTIPVDRNFNARQARFAGDDDGVFFQGVGSSARSHQLSMVVRGAAYALNLPPLSAAYQTWPDLQPDRPGRECRVGPGNFTLSLSQNRA